VRSFAIALALILSVGLFVLPGESAAAADDNGSWGTIKGRIVIQGAVPKPEAADVDKDKEHCLSKGPLFKEKLVVNPKNKGVRWVIVWLAPEPPADDAPAVKLPIHPDLKKFDPEVSMDQPCCQFVPHALGVRQGQTLIIKNSAPVAHNVRWLGNPAVAGRGGNVIVPPGKSHAIKGLKTNDKVALPVVNINCDFHKWMSARVAVFDHPYFAVTDKDGNFEIKKAPAGQWRLKVLHESGWLGKAKGRSGQKITVKGGGVTKLGNLVLKP
jgi:hypothetical protein